LGLLEGDRGPIWIVSVKNLNADFDDLLELNPHFAAGG
jgi:hypothetical protein